MEQLQISPGSSVSEVHFVFKVKDKSTGVNYSGSFLLGIKNPNRLHLEEILKREILKWVSWIRFTPPPLSKMILKWDIPETQNYIVSSIDSQHIIVDLSLAMGVSIQEIFSSSFEMISSEIIIINVPKNAITVPRV